jgi:hypothetical protein
MTCVLNGQATLVAAHNRPYTSNLLGDYSKAPGKMQLLGTLAVQPN